MNLLRIVSCLAVVFVTGVEPANRAAVEPVSSTQPASQGVGLCDVVRYDIRQQLEGEGSLGGAPCAGFGCTAPCTFTFQCPFPGVPVGFADSVPLTPCGIASSFTRFSPILNVSDSKTLAGASAMATTTGSCGLTAYANSRSLGARLFVEAGLTANATDNACAATPLPPGAKTTADGTLETRIPFTVTQGAQYAFTAQLSVGGCAVESATGTWIMVDGPTGQVVAQGVSGIDAANGQGFIPPGDYVLVVHLDSQASVCACAPCGGTATDGCNHSADFTFGITIHPCLGDIDGDGQVGTSDLLALIGAWGPCPEIMQVHGCPCDGGSLTVCRADLNGDRVVDNLDLIILLGKWGLCVP